MKLKNIIWIILMVLFMMLSYLFFDRGFKVRTRIITNYKEDSDIVYKVYLHENDIYNNAFLEMNENYIANLVDNIDINFKYDAKYDKDISGYYRYRVEGNLITYKDFADEIVFTKEYQILNNKVNVLNNNSNRINVNDRVIIDYDKYKLELDKIREEYELNVSGYLEVNIIVEDFINFKNLNNEINDIKTMKIIIPLSMDTFKINIMNDIKNIDGSYNDFSNREDINYIFLVIGAILLSFGLSFLAVIIRDIVMNSKMLVSYDNKLEKIVKEHDDILVKVKKFYNKQKYNLIYVDSFEELLNVYDKIKNPISYKEVKKGEETIFLMINEEDAWIYRLINDKK